MATNWRLDTNPYNSIIKMIKDMQVVNPNKSMLEVCQNTRRLGRYGPTIKDLMSGQDAKIEALKSEIIEAAQLYEVRVTQFEELRGSLHSVRDAVTGIADALQRCRVECRDALADRYVQVRCDANAQPYGTVSVRVEKLATQDSLQETADFKGFNSQMESLNLAGNFVLTLGDEETSIAIEAADSLRGITGKISAIGKVSAVIVCVKPEIKTRESSGNSDGEYRLKIQAVGEGVKLGIKADTESLLIANALHVEESASLAEDLQAQLWVNDIKISRKTNAISDLLSGITLLLKQAGPEQPLRFSVIRDQEALEASVKQFANAWKMFLSMCVLLTKAWPSDWGVLLRDVHRSLVRTLHDSCVVGQHSGVGLLHLGFRNINATSEFNFDAGKLQMTFMNQPHDAWQFLEKFSWPVRRVEDRRLKERRILEDLAEWLGEEGLCYGSPGRLSSAFQDLQRKEHGKVQKFTQKLEEMEKKRTEDRQRGVQASFKIEQTERATDLLQSLRF